MKISSKVSCLLAFCGVISFSVASYAGVCFVVGDCGDDKIASRCGSDYNGYIFETCKKGFELGGNLCSYNGRTKYQRCQCNTAYFQHIIPTDGQSPYNYLEKVEKSSEKGRYCEENRARARYCKSEYAYAETSDIANSWNSPQVLPKACKNGMVPDEEAGVCVETDSIRLGGNPYKKYKACRCPALPEGQEWKSCNKAHQIGKGDSCDGKYKECECNLGFYMKEPEGICVANTPNTPEKEEFVGECKNANGIQYKNNRLSKVSCDTPQNPKWKIYYISGQRDEEIRSLACKFMENNPDERVEVVITGGSAEDVVGSAATEFDDVYEVNLHPLFSSLLGVGQADWGFDLGVAEKPMPYKNGKAYKADGYNFPLLMYGVIHTAGAYDMYCGDKDKMNDDPREYGYYGWLGGIQTWVDSINEPVFGGGSSEAKVSAPVKALMFRPYNYSKSCHPAEFAPYEEYECKGDDCAIMKKNAKADNIKSFGGDKCLNFVFNLNEKDLMLPALVVNTEDRVAYHINSEPRFMIEYESLRWAQQKVSVGSESYTDYSGNFLRWDINNNTALGAKNACEKVCYDRRDEYKDVKGGYVDTYPYMNSYWEKEVASGNVSADAGLKTLFEQKNKDTDSNILKTFIGGNGYSDINSGEGSSDWRKRKYFNNNVKNVLNGVLGISNPMGALRKEGSGADKNY